MEEWHKHSCTEQCSGQSCFAHDRANFIFNCLNILGPFLR